MYEGGEREKTLLVHPLQRTPLPRPHRTRREHQPGCGGGGARGEVFGYNAVLNNLPRTSVDDRPTGGGVAVVLRRIQSAARLVESTVGAVFRKFTHQRFPLVVGAVFSARHGAPPGELAVYLDGGLARVEERDQRITVGTVERAPRDRAAEGAGSPRETRDFHPLLPALPVALAHHRQRIAFFIAPRRVPIRVQVEIRAGRDIPPHAVGAHLGSNKLHGTRRESIPPRAREAKGACVRAVVARAVADLGNLRCHHCGACPRAGHGEEGEGGGGGTVGVLPIDAAEQNTEARGIVHAPPRPQVLVPVARRYHKVVESSGHRLTLHTHPRPVRARLHHGKVHEALVRNHVARRHVHREGGASDAPRHNVTVARRRFAAARVVVGAPPPLLLLVSWLEELHMNGHRPRRDQ